MAEKIRTPAQHLEDFLNAVDQCAKDYQYSSGIVSEEDKRLLDLVHEMEFAADSKERNRVATRMQKSRVLRRQNKDIVKQNELLVKFFEEPENRKVLNKLRQLLGRQRKEEEYLASDRTYKPRVK